ncbi:MAG: hypothetical protein KDC43_23620 [Saprospiraceae bacterium]|nr:hypothetical protein [Saprospiraceae bacterium]MCB0626823.1 hypothetical protein [Saprospiraceae bacterium]MCB0678129.1 hypothetical protein [Saprospiraceae bacterium]MCB0682850.1 hypothetical protein [Saprospiraceae bacterium]
MQYRQEYSFKGNTLTTILVFVLVFAGIYFVAKGVFWFLSLLAPVLLIAALIIDYRVALNYGKWLIQLTRNNLLAGLGAILLSVLGYPIVFALLLGKALFNRKLRQLKQDEQLRREGELIDFEEVDSRQHRVELPPLREREAEKEKGDSEYDDLFK